MRTLGPRPGVFARTRAVTVIGGVLWAAVLLTPGGSGIAQAKKVNPYTGKPAAIHEGRTLYLRNGCSGCHGVMGGGGMAMPLLDDVWKFGSDDETLYKLIKGMIPGQVMPRVWAALPDDEVWKMIAYIRSLYAGDPSKVNW